MSVTPDANRHETASDIVLRKSPTVSAILPRTRIAIPADWEESATHAGDQTIEFDPAVTDDITFNPDPIDDLDSVSIFADVATREVALDGELQATQVTLAQLRELGMNVVNWFANYKAGLATLYELERQIDSLHESVRTTNAHDFGAHVLLTNERQTVVLEQARATIESFIGGETTMGALSRLADAINDILPATSPVGGAA